MTENDHRLGYKLRSIERGKYLVELQGDPVGSLRRNAPYGWTIELLQRSEDAKEADQTSWRREKFELLVQALNWLGNPPCFDAPSSADDAPLATVATAAVRSKARPSASRIVNCRD